MFDIGFWELIVVLIVALLAIRPKDLPGALKKTGQMLNHLKHSWHKLREDISTELNDAHIHEHLKQAEMKDFKNLSVDIQHSLDTLQAQTQSVQRPYQQPQKQKNLCAGNPPQCPTQPPSAS